MIRILARAVLSLIANAVALLVADVVLEDVSLEASGFITAVLIFTGVSLVIEPLVRQTAIRNAPAILGSTALVATLVSLVVTVLVSDGLGVSGAWTWVLATVIIWIVALLARLFLPLIMFKRVLAESEDERRETQVRKIM